MIDPDTEIEERIRALADKLDCAVEDDVRMLAGITHGTASAWRKRGMGPPYILFGNVYLYPRKALREFLESEIREPRKVPAQAVL